MRYICNIFFFLFLALSLIQVLAQTEELLVAEKSLNVEEVFEKNSEEPSKKRADQASSTEKPSKEITDPSSPIELNAFSIKKSHNRRGQEVNDHQRELSAQIHRSMFDREHLERELSHHHEEKKELNLEDEIDTKDLGNGVELKWKSHKK